MFPSEEGLMMSSATGHYSQHDDYSDRLEHDVDRLPAIPQASPQNARPSPTFPVPHSNDFNLIQPFQDPRGRRYSSHNRRIRNFREEGKPSRMKVGRAGGSWRHVSYTNGHQGNNILFIEGTVKQDDAALHPPYGWKNPFNSHFMNYVSQRTVPLTSRGQRHPNSNYATSVNEKARKGFKYWYEERKPRTNNWLWETPEITAKVN